MTVALSCGGKFVIDRPEPEGAGGSSTTNTTNDSTSTLTSVASGATEQGASTSIASGGPECDNTGICTDLSGGPSCVACAGFGVCNDLTMACLSSDDCRACDQCASDCTNKSCVQDCLASHPFGAALYLGFYTCIICDACQNDCNVEFEFPPICPQDH